MRQYGEGTFDPRFGKGGVNGAGGNLGGLGGPATPIPGVLGGPVSPIDRGLGGPAAPIPGMLGGPNTTGSPVGYNPLNQIQTGIVPGDPMSQIGNQGAIAHGQHTTDSFVNGVPRYFPGSHDPRQHNELRDPAGRPIPGTAPPDSEIPLGYETNQSSNLPTSITQSPTTFGVGNNQGLVANVEAGPVLPGEGRKVWPRDGSAPGRGGIEIAQAQTSNLLNPLDWFSGRNQKILNEVEEGTYKGGKGGPVDNMLQRKNTLNDLIKNM